MLRRMALLSLVTVTAGGLLPGCVYLKDRGNDLLDMGGVELSAGVQAGANVRVTKLAQIGAGFNTGDAAAWDNRTAACYEENRWEIGVSVLYANSAARYVHAANDNYVERDQFDEKEHEYYDLNRNFDRGFFEVGGRVGLGFLGVGAYVDPYQIFDFVLGIVGLDIARDDRDNQDRPDLYGPPANHWPQFPDGEGSPQQ